MGLGSEGERMFSAHHTSCTAFPWLLPEPLLQVPAPKVSESARFLKVLEKERVCPSFSPSFLQ